MTEPWTLTVGREESAAGMAIIPDAASHRRSTRPRTGPALDKVTLGSSERTAELGRALLALAHEQTRHHLEVLRALTEAVDWDNRTRTMDWGRILRLQGEVLQRSQARTAQLHQRYLELTRAALEATAPSRGLATLPELWRYRTKCV